jgi:outer membrane immunogenic protein
MRNVWLYGLTVAGLATSGALAADPPLVSSIYKAPVAVREPAPWTGLYAGLNAGYGWGNQRVQETGDAVTGGQQAVNAGAIPASLAGRPTGFLAGGQLGVNYQVNKVVLGIEADWQWAQLIDQQTVSTSVATFNQFTTNARQDIEFFGTARARLGFTPIQPVLLYVTGGLAYADVKLSGSIVNPGCFGFCGATSTSDYQTGWTAGGGVEYAFAPNWSAKVEYLYYDLGNLSQQILDPRTPGAFIAQSVAFRGNIVRAGVNYRFYGDDSDY